MVPNTKDVGRFIRERRNLLGLSQEALARAVSVSKTTVANWENGTHGIRSGNVAALTRALKVADSSQLCADDTVDLGQSLVREQEERPAHDTRAALYAFLQSDLALGMDPPPSPLEIAMLLDEHVSGDVGPEYFYHTVMRERARRPSTRPSERPNEAHGAAEAGGLRKRHQPRVVQPVVTQKRLSRRP